MLANFPLENKRKKDFFFIAEQEAMPLGRNNHHSLFTFLTWTWISGARMSSGERASYAGRPRGIRWYSVHLNGAGQTSGLLDILYLVSHQSNLCLAHFG